MAVRQETPIRRGPVVRAPEERRRGTPVRSRILGSVILAGAVGLAALGGYEVYNNSQKTPEPTPIAGGIGEPTPTPTFEITITPIPEATPTPTPTPEPTTPEYSMKPDVSQAPEAKSLEDRINEWMQGEKVSSNDRFRQNGKPLIFNIVEGNLDKLNSDGIIIMSYQGKLLGSKIVDDHVEAYYGLESAINGGVRWFVRVNYGDVTIDQYSAGVVKKGSSFDTSNPSFYKIKLKNLNKLFQTNAGKAMLFNIYPYTDHRTPSPTDTASIAELNSQTNYARAFVTWSFEASHGQPDLTPPAGINEQATSFDPRTTLMGVEISIIGDQ